jgi:hypothetical protein
MTSHLPYIFEEAPVGVSLLLSVDVGPTYSDGARVSPWHTLTFRGFSPGPSAEHPRLAFKEQASGLWSEDADIGIEPTANGFTVQFWSWNALGEGRPREHVRSYRRHAGRFERVQPFVARARDLPDEWIRLPWSEAAHLSAPGKLAVLEPWHARIKTAKGLRGDDYPFMVLEAEEPDPAAIRQWATFKCDGCKPLPARIHFEMVRESDGYLIGSVSSKP